MPFLSDIAITEFVETPSGRLAYRRFGERGERPLVLFHRFRGTIDHWDPAFLEVLATERDVIVFDSAGVGFSEGTTPTSISGMAEVGVQFLTALDLGPSDLLGWSLGGFVVQLIALDHPELVNKIVVAGSGPGAVPGAASPEARVGEAMTSKENSDEDFLFLFFGRSAKAREAGRESLSRLETRLASSGADVRPESWQAQLAAISQWASGNGDAWSRIGDLKSPVLVANGAQDVMVDAYGSYAIVRQIENADVILYGDSGHGFLFQRPDEFGQVALDFLR